MLKRNNTEGSHIEDELFEAMKDWEDQHYNYEGGCDYEGIMVGGASPAPEYEDLQVTVMEQQPTKKGYSM